MENSNQRVTESQANQYETSTLEYANNLEPSAENERSMLNLVCRLLTILRTERVVFCHWKSNNLLNKSARGDTDLDLLVRRSDVQRFVEVLYRLGFKETRGLAAEKQVPGIVSYFGYDADSGKIINVHAHYQLILGHDNTKNYRLPLDEAFLETAVQEGQFLIPAPEFEFIIFVFRMVLKHSTWDALLGRQGTLAEPERQELQYLQDRISPDIVKEYLIKYLFLIDTTLFEDCIQSLRLDANSWQKIKTGQKLQAILETHSRRTKFLNSIIKLMRRFNTIIQGRVFRNVPKKRLVSGGAVISLVGGDGAGKSTAIEELFNWFSKDFDTKKVHMGKPPRSLFTLAIDVLLRLGRETGNILKQDWTVQSVTNPNIPGLLISLMLLRHVFTARDRYRIYVKMRRFAINGGLVISDRWYLPNICLMDGPKIRQGLGKDQNKRFLRFLMKTEEKYYVRMKAPDLLIVLKVDPEIAVQRRKGDDIAAVRMRCQEIWEANWDGTRPAIIDANRPKEKVILDVKTAVWSFL